MEFVHKLINITFIPLALFAFFLSMPLNLFFRFFFFLWRSQFSENVAGKVVLITGASAGIGECIVYEYARRGACLALGARREDRLREVEREARRLGSPDVIIIQTDVSNIADCKRMVEQVVSHFGRLDHLVNNAGIAQEPMLFEDVQSFSHLPQIMEINYWGSVYCTHFSIPHLQNSKGKIIVISSAASWLSNPRMSFYNASKGALESFYETIKCELIGSGVRITIVTPGVVRSEMTASDLLAKMNIGFVPMSSARVCARGVVDGACRGDAYITEPYWVKVGFLWKTFYPELVNFLSYHLIAKRQHPKTDAKSD